MIYVYCNANSEVGYGHLSRCLSICRWLVLSESTISIHFYGKLDDFAVTLLDRYNFSYSIKNSFVEFSNLFSQDYQEENFENQLNVLIDSYLINQKDIDCITEKEKVGIKTIFVDDFHKLDFSKADLVINFTVNAHSLNYTAKKTLLGTKYFIVKPELANIRENNKKIDKIAYKNILLFMTGFSFNFDTIKFLLEFLDDYFDGIKINIITSQQNFEFQSKKTALHQNKFIRLDFTPKIENYLKEADLIISGGGLTKYESAYCKIPNVVLNFQEEIYQETLAFEREGLCYNLGLLGTDSTKKILEKMRFFLDNPSSTNFFFDSSIQKFDTFSTQNIAKTILSL